MVFVGLSDDNQTQLSFIRNPSSVRRPSFVSENVGINIGRRSAISFAGQVVITAKHQA